MRYRLFPTIVILFIGTCTAQTFFPRKDLAFGQVAVGDSIDTQITVTNRGVWDYVGTLFFRKGESEIWNPVVNGAAVSSGRLPILLEPGETQTLTVTGSGLQTGTLMLFSDDLVLDNFIEGNLTYFFKSAGSITDSVGLGSSQEFYLATLPFEDFATVGLALVNGNVQLGEVDPQPRADANVTLRLYDEDGNLVSTSNDPILTGMVPMTHVAQFLRDFFPSGIQLGRGKVEISSDVPIYGTALTFLFVDAGTQSSSLPLEPSPVPYAIQINFDDNSSLAGDLTLWAEGYFVKGYLVVNSANGGEVLNKVLTIVNGQLIDGILELSFYAQGEAFQTVILDDEVSLVLEILDGFSFSQSAPPNGLSVMTSLIDPTATLVGSFTMSQLEP
jgi:hypothetical protein